MDLEHAYGQIKLLEEASKHCNFSKTWGNMNGYHTFKKGFYGLYDIPTKFDEKIDGTLNYQTPVWLDDLLIVTRGSKEKHRVKLFTIHEQLPEAGYRAILKKSEFFLKKTTWLGHEMSKHWMKPTRKSSKTILQLRSPASSEELESFLRAIHYIAKLLPKLSEKPTRSNYFGRNRNWNRPKVKKRTLTTLRNLWQKNHSLHSLLQTEKT